MKNLFVIFLAFTFALGINQVKAQNSEQAKENKNLADLKTAESTMELRAQIVNKSWPVAGKYYPVAHLMYTEAAGYMDGAIELSIDEFTDSVQSKRKRNTDSIYADFKKAINSINSFNTYVKANDSLAEVRTRGQSTILPNLIPLIIPVVTVTESLVKFISDSFNSKTKMIKDFTAKMNAYKLPPWESLK
jgi:hypothetical protein